MTESPIEWRIIPETNYKYEMNNNKDVRKRMHKNYIKNYSNDFRYIFIPKVNQPPPAKTRDEVYQLTFKDPQYVYPTIPDEFKTFGDRFFDKLKAENCKPISDYINSITPVYYLFNDNQYKVRPHNWIHYNSRPHIKQTRKPRTKKCNNECNNECNNVCIN